jgi:hypothetical protein
MPILIYFAPNLDPDPLVLTLNKKILVLKGTEKSSKIRIRFSEVRMPVSGSVPKCHRSATLKLTSVADPDPGFRDWMPF